MTPQRAPTKQTKPPTPPTTANHHKWSLLILSASCCLLLVQRVQCGASSSPYQAAILAGRRAADDSRPVLRVHQRDLRFAASDSSASAETPSDQIVMGKFKAPAPERIHRQRVPKNSDFASQVMSASYRVGDASGSMPEKVVHGIVGSSVSGGQQAGARSRANNERTVGAKIQVSDEGLNYPPSKLSADIYGNVAEIVTAPPEAVESDFLLPLSNSIYSNRRARAF